MDGLRLGQQEHKSRPIDGQRTVRVARTPRHAPFKMGPFRGRVETLDLGGGATAHVLHNFDGVRGANLAKSLEGCYGLDVLEGQGSTAKCAAAQGNNCQDSYTKLYPTRMFLDQDLSELMGDVLCGVMAAVNASLPAGKPKLELSQGARPGGIGGSGTELVTGEVQVLKFRAKNGPGYGNRMHIHIDKPGTRWVTIMSLGETSTFVFDNALQCERCFAPSRKLSHKGARIKPNLNHGGTGVAKTAGMGHKDWHNVKCDSCKLVDLKSGDCLLFHGSPESNVAHGSLSTRLGDAPDGLPGWCYGGRVSVQYRLSAGFRATDGQLY